MKQCGLRARRPSGAWSPGRLGICPELFAVAVLVVPLNGAGAASPPRPPAPAPITPTLIEIGQGRDGLVTYVARGYAPASAGVASIGGTASGDFSFRVGGSCVESSDVSLVPAGVSANTTAWSYALNGASVALVEDAPQGSCKYTARVTYTLSVTGAVTINQMEYTVYLKGRPAAGAASGGLAVIP
jgi:hypothetical protein